MARKLVGFIEGFLEYTIAKGSPQIFCLWTAAAVVAMALERKVWISNKRGLLHPNMYTMLVGPPGSGKTQVIDVAYSLMASLETHHVASSNVSRASLVDDIKDAERSIVMPGHEPPNMTFNSLSVIADELAVFMPAYENDFMSILNHIYTGQAYSERKRTRDLKFSIPHPQLNLLAGTQPGYLSDLLPEAAWNQGFLSRTILVYDGIQVLQPLWGGEEVDDTLWDKLVHDLHIIGELYGEFEFEPEAAQFINDWHMGRGKPTPTHPKLMYYVQRRTAHLLKLSMVASASESDDLIITLPQVQTALGWLLQAEALMPDIFKAMKTGGDMRAMEDCWHFGVEIFSKEKRPIAEGRLVAFLAERVPAQSVSRILDIMTQAGMFKKGVESGVGFVYTPRRNDIS